MSPYRETTDDAPWVPCWGLHVAGLAPEYLTTGRIYKPWSMVQWYALHDRESAPVLDYGTILKIQERIAEKKALSISEVTITFFAVVWLETRP